MLASGPKPPAPRLGVQPGDMRGRWALGRAEAASGEGAAAAGVARGVQAAAAAAAASPDMEYHGGMVL